MDFGMRDLAVQSGDQKDIRDVQRMDGTHAMQCTGAIGHRRQIASMLPQHHFALAHLIIQGDCGACMENLARGPRFHLRAGDPATTRVAS